MNQLLTQASQSCELSVIIELLFNCLETPKVNTNDKAEIFLLNVRFRIKLMLYKTSLISEDHLAAELIQLHLGQDRS